MHRWRRRRVLELFLLAAVVAVLSLALWSRPPRDRRADPAVDLTEGRPGPRLHLAVQVTDEQAREVAGARVEVWHADPSGRYSQPPETFARGACDTGPDGMARFRTLMPGGYGPQGGRRPHVHMRVRGSGGIANLSVDVPGSEGPSNSGPGHQAWLAETGNGESPVLHVQVTLSPQPPPPPFPRDPRGGPGAPPFPQEPGAPPVPGPPR